MGNIEKKLNSGSLSSLIDIVKDNVFKNLKVADVCVVRDVGTTEDIPQEESEKTSEVTDVESSGWVGRNNISGIKYGESSSEYYWSQSKNPNATFGLCLPNCTTYAYGRVQEAGCNPPVSSIHNAKNWHNYVANDWTAITFDEANVSVGDILEWTAGSAGHVAVVENINPIVVSASDYTDQSCGWPLAGARTPGISWGGSPYPISTMRDISTWLSMKAPNRFFRYGTLANENARAGASPTYILKNPGEFYSNTRQQLHCQSITTGLMSLCYCSQGLMVSQGDLVVVLYTDMDFRDNLTKARNEENIIALESDGNYHNSSYGIIVSKL